MRRSKKFSHQKNQLWLFLTLVFSVVGVLLLSYAPTSRSQLFAAHPVTGDEPRSCLMPEDCADLGTNYRCTAGAKDCDPNPQCDPHYNVGQECPPELREQCWGVCVRGSEDEEGEQTLEDFCRGVGEECWRKVQEEQREELREGEGWSDDVIEGAIEDCVRAEAPQCPFEEEEEEEEEEEGRQCEPFFRECDAQLSSIEGRERKRMWRECMEGLGAPEGCYEYEEKGEEYEYEYEEGEGDYKHFARDCKDLFKKAEQMSGGNPQEWERIVAAEDPACLGGEEEGGEQWREGCTRRAEVECGERTAQSGIAMNCGLLAQKICAGEGFSMEHMPPGPPRFEERREGMQGGGVNAAAMLAKAAGTIVELSQRPNLPEAVKILLTAAAKAVGELLIKAAQGEPIANLIPAVKAVIGPLASMGSPGFGPGGPGGPGFGPPPGMMGQPGVGPPGEPGMMGPGMVGGGPMMFMPDVSQVEPQVTMMIAMMEKMFGKVEQAFARMGGLLGVDFGEDWKDDLADLQGEFEEVKAECEDVLASGDFERIREECFEALGRFPERMERFKEYAMRVVEEEGISEEKVGGAMQTVEQEIFSDVGPPPGMMGPMGPGMEGGMPGGMQGEFRGGMMPGGMPGGMMGPGMQEFFTGKGECFQRMAEGPEAVKSCMGALMEKMGGGMGPMGPGMPGGFRPEGFEGGEGYHEGRFGPGFMREGGGMEGGRFEERRNAMEACKGSGKPKEECVQEMRERFREGPMGEGGFPGGSFPGAFGEGVHRGPWGEGESPQNPYFRGKENGGGRHFGPWRGGMEGGMQGGMPGMGGYPGGGDMMRYPEGQYPGGGEFQFQPTGEYHPPPQ